MTRITTDLLLHAYGQGYFPMAESARSQNIFWLDPEQRGIIPLDEFHVPRRLARTVRSDIFTVTTDRAFADVIDACAAEDRSRNDTWINPLIVELYCKLYREAHAHSIECWRDGKLVGGLYGVSLGAAFFGESMFSRQRDASKVALVHLVARLITGGYRLLDTQFVTPHLQQFGAVEIPRETYRDLLADAVSADADYSILPSELSGAAILQVIAQTS